jgi:hypothetical protein
MERCGSACGDAEIGAARSAHDVKYDPGSHTGKWQRKAPPVRAKLKTEARLLHEQDGP